MPPTVHEDRGGSSRALSSPYLDEANVGALLTEALTADVEAVLADQTGTVGADAAVSLKSHVSLPFILSFLGLPLPHLPISFALLGCSPQRLFQVGGFVPFAGALAVRTGAGVPDRLVRHLDD